MNRLLRSRSGPQYRATSYSAFALLARMRMLDFCRIVQVERDGKQVKRMVNAPDLTLEERRAHGLPQK